MTGIRHPRYRGSGDLSSSVCWWLWSASFVQKTQSQYEYFDRQDSRTFPLSHDPEGKQFYISVLVGDNYQNKSLVVNFNSTFTGFTCQGCSTCSPDHWQPLYEMSGTVVKVGSAEFTQQTPLPFVRSDSRDTTWKCPSQSSEPEFCSFATGYKPTSYISGRYVTLPITLPEARQRGQSNSTKMPDQPNPTMIVGCITEESGIYRQKGPDGSIGLGPASREILHRCTRSQQTTRLYLATQKFGFDEIWPL